MERVFITHETYTAICEVAGKRSMIDVIKESNKIYSMLKDDVEASLKFGDDYITRTVERRVGKTTALIRLAIEYQLPIVVPSNDIKSITERIARDITADHVEVLVVNKFTNGRNAGLRYRVVLKEEKVSMFEIKRQLKPVSIIGID